MVQTNDFICTYWSFCFWYILMQKIKNKCQADQHILQQARKYCIHARFSWRRWRPTRLTWQSMDFQAPPYLTSLDSDFSLSGCQQHHSSCARLWCYCCVLCIISSEWLTPIIGDFISVVRDAFQQSASRRSSLFPKQLTWTLDALIVHNRGSTELWGAFHLDPTRGKHLSRLGISNRDTGDRGWGLRQNKTFSGNCSDHRQGDPHPSRQRPCVRDSPKAWGVDLRYAAEGCRMHHKGLVAEEMHCLFYIFRPAVMF